MRSTWHVPVSFEGCLRATRTATCRSGASIQNRGRPSALTTSDLGYFAVYAYDDVSNLNPGLTALRLDGASQGASCAGPASRGPEQACGSSGCAFRRCPAALTTTRTIALHMRSLPWVEPSSVERAVTGNLREQDAPLETLWWLGSRQGEL